MAKSNIKASFPYFLERITPPPVKFIVLRFETMIRHLFTSIYIMLFVTHQRRCRITSLRRHSYADRNAIGDVHSLLHQFH